MSVSADEVEKATAAALAHLASRSRGDARRFSFKKQLFHF
jgi:hypothetical protein